MSAFPASRVKTAPVPATTGTSLTVLEDAGALFPVPPFTVVVWPLNTLPDVGVNAEQPEVTAVDGDVLTLTRGTPAVAIEADMEIAVLLADPLVQLNEPVTLSGVFSANLPPYTLRTRSPQGTINSAGTVVDAGGGTVSSVLNADESGFWYYRFESADEVLAERRFFVPFSSVL